MLRTIKISVDPPYIDPGSTLKHIGTSYQVSNSPDFATVSNLILNVNNDTVNVNSIVFNHDMTPSTPLYLRTRCHFNNGMASEWSSIVPFTSDQLGIKTSNTIVSTPVVTGSIDYTLDNSGVLVATTKYIGVIAGPGKVNSVSWKITDTDDNVLYELPKSTDVLSVLKIPLSSIGNPKTVCIYVVLHTDTNVDSNIGRGVVITHKIPAKYFNGKIKDNLYNNSANHAIFTSHSSKPVDCDINIKSQDGQIVLSFTGLNPYSPEFIIDNLITGNHYTVEARMNVANGSTTPWVTIFDGPITDREVRTYAPGLPYVTTEMSFGKYLDFNGLSTQAVQADTDNVFYLAIPETTIIAEYRISNGVIYNTGNTFDMGAGNMFSVPSMHYMKLHNGQILIDHTVNSIGGNIEVARFSLFNYNQITKKLTYVHSLDRPDERFGTGRTGSAVVTKGDLVYYIPGEIFDANGKELDLELRVYDVASNSIVDNIPLPVTGLKHNVSLATDDLGNIYMFGGTDIPTRNAAHGEIVSVMLNKKIFKLDKVNKTWTPMLTLTTANNQSYRYNMQTLKNGNIFIIDTTPNIVDGGIRKSYIYDTHTNSIAATINNNPSREHIGIIVELPTGDIATISSTSDVVEAISFLRTSVSDIVADTTAISDSKAVANLVVAQGDTVYIRDPYRYDSITILGTSMSNTGKLVWIENDKVTTYYYNDRIITRNTTITTVTGQPVPTYNRFVVVGDAVVTLITV